MAPVIRALDKYNSELRTSNIEYFILHTGQHYSYNLDSIFFQQLELPQPKYNLDVGSGTHAEETGKMIIGIEKLLLEEKPDVVLIEGDTNSVLAGALAAAKLHTRVGHVEAGLRSYDRSMPEELNRVLTDHLADYLFAPTEKARDILLGEGIPEEKIFVTGNTIVDAVYQNLEIAKVSSKLKSSRFNVNLANSEPRTSNLEPRNYFLVTVHRQENVDVKDRLEGILEGLGLVYQKFRLPLIYPVHPRAKRSIEEFRLRIPSGVRLIEPVGFFDFLALEADAALVLTDSGGVQEETCILKVPCVTLRNNTERPETLEVGSNILSGVAPGAILNCTEEMLSAERDWPNPFGDGQAGARIVRTISRTRKAEV